LDKLNEEDIFEGEDVRRLTDQAVKTMPVSTMLKSILEDYRRNLPSKMKKRVVEDMVTGYKEWVASCGIISALVSSMCVEPLIQIQAADTTIIQIYICLLAISLFSGICSIIALVQILGLLVCCPSDDHAWYFSTFSSHAQAPSTLMVVSMASLLLAVVTKLGDSIGTTNYAFYGTVGCLTVGTFSIITWVLSMEILLKDGLEVTSWHITQSMQQEDTARKNPWRRQSTSGRRHTDLEFYHVDKDGDGQRDTGRDADCCVWFWNHVGECLIRPCISAAPVSSSN